MQTVIGLFIAISIAELIIWFPFFWVVRRSAAQLSIALLGIVTALLTFARPSVWMLCLGFLSLYRIVNLLRLVRNRIQVDYLHKTSSVTSLTLIGLQLGLIIMMSLGDMLNISSMTWLRVFSIGQLVIAAVVFASTQRHLLTTRPVPLTKSFSDKELPTVTVAIPARNETDNLNECLQSLISSNYPKLEILVLDDCSQDKRTPEIIRNFALQGVRFIAGQVPPSKWLAKNYAYQQLVEEASGDLIVFCGVDVRFEPNSLKSLVELALQKNKAMISLIPVNKLGHRLSIWPLMVQPSRYAWELALPRRLFRRPAVLSTCWMIRKDLLLSSGGFEAVANSISPESYFARQVISRSDGYSFTQTDSQFAIFSVKNIDDQRATAIRTRYPQLHRRPEMIAIVSALEFVTLMLPIILVVSSLINFDPLILTVNLLGASLQLISYGRIVDLCYDKVVWQGYVALPLAAIYDIALLNYSMLRYEFSDVTWKDRNICLPVMNNRDGFIRPKTQ